jgi:hypothetical protein
MGSHDRLIVISRLVLGGPSSAVKAVLDRSIGFVLPFFDDLCGKARHAARYESSPGLFFFYYGPGDPEEMDTARELTLANSRNFMSPESGTRFFQSMDALRGALTDDLGEA